MTSGDAGQAPRTGSSDAGETVAPPEPLVTRDRTAVAVGCVVWAVLLVAALLRRDDLLASGRGWWVWTCICGLALGAVGLLHLQRRSTRTRRSSQT